MPKAASNRYALFVQSSDSGSLEGVFLMSGSPKQMFRGITRSIFFRLRKKASKIGIHVVSPTGEALKDGVKIQWNYDATAELLEVECISTPFWFNSTQINKNLREEIEATLDMSRAA
jgi:hypothetical protein